MNAIRTMSVLLLLSSSAQAVQAAAATGASAPASVKRLPFVDDDYARAIRDARERGVPVFVEAWAPW